jgi:hypothetical protein
MYLLLLMFGGLLGAAGVVLAASGISPRDGTFDAAILTPGIVAAIGGLLLVGLGAGLRTLQRIERTLASRPMPRGLPIPESAKAPESVETPREPARIPFAPRPSTESRPGVASRNIFGDKSPDSADDADRTSAPVPVAAMAAAHDATAEAAQRSGKSGNGAAGVRTGLRLPGSLRRTSERQSEPPLDALWPKGPRPSRSIEAAPGPTAQSPSAPPIQMQQSADPPHVAAAVIRTDSAAAVSVLKSGVVNGMPYTLYSDGSIEAQLPEGTLRFGSITELRNHIEQSA